MIFLVSNLKSWVVGYWLFYAIDGNVSTHTIKKLINTNRNIEGIFPLKLYRWILPTTIFPRYLPRELQVGNKIIKTKQKKKHLRDDFTNEITRRINFIDKTIDKLWILFIMSITERITDGIFQRALELFTF